MSGKAIRVRGIVQGVGFRPTIWRLAKQHQLTGTVWNDEQGVMIHAFGSTENIEAFIRQIPLQLPPLAKLDSLEIQALHELAQNDDFHIIASHSDHNIQTPITADAATCPACLADIADPKNRRYRYPFTNCTHCGPRLSIIRSVPYDRCHTSMAAFTLCPLCRQEYDNPADRPFSRPSQLLPGLRPQSLAGG